MLFHSLIGHTVENDCNFSLVNAGCHHISVSQTADLVYVRAPTGSLRHTSGRSGLFIIAEVISYDTDPNCHVSCS